MRLKSRSFANKLDVVPGKRATRAQTRSHNHRTSFDGARATARRNDLALWLCPPPAFSGRTAELVFDNRVACQSSSRTTEARMTDQFSSDWLGLAGRVCVVTGAGGGIGR